MVRRWPAFTPSWAVCSPPALIFLLSKRFGSRVMKRFAGSNYAALIETAKKHDFKFALVTTLNPLLPTDVMIAAASASGARFWPTVAGVLVGTFPGTLMTAQFGSALSQGKTMLTVLSAAGMIVSLLFGVFLGRRMVKDFNNLSEEQKRERPARGAPPLPAQAGRGLADARVAPLPRRRARLGSRECALPS